MLNSLENIILDAEQKRNIQRLTEQIQDRQEQALQLMDALLPRYHITVGTVLCPGACQDCGKHAPVLFAAHKKTEMQTEYLFCFLCYWKSIGYPWGTKVPKPASSLDSVRPA